MCFEGDLRLASGQGLMRMDLSRSKDFRLHERAAVPGQIHDITNSLNFAQPNMFIDGVTYPHSSVQSGTPEGTSIHVG